MNNQQYEFKGTQGAWVDMGGDNLSIDIVLPDNTTISIDRCDRFSGKPVIERSQMEANAHLTAAAPDLLEACIDLVEQFERVEPLYSKDKEIINKAKKAIHKALNI